MFVSIAVCMLLVGSALLPTPAHADTYVAYNVTNAQLQDGSLFGTFGLDATGNAANINLVLMYGSNAAIIFNNGVIDYLELDLVPGNNANIAALIADSHRTLVFMNDEALAGLSNRIGDDLFFDRRDRADLHAFHLYVPAGHLDGSTVDPPPNDPSPVPEPSTLLLLASGLMPIGFLSRRWLARQPK
jgi:PEP-CTERM motif